MLKRIISLILCAAVVLTTLLTALPVPAAAAGTASLKITRLAADKTTVLAETTITWQTMKDTLPVLGDGVTHYYHQGPVYIDNPDPLVEEQLRWNQAEDTNVQEKDYGALRGTNIKDLCGLVGGIASGEELKIKSSDGWNKMFAYKNIYQYSAKEGPMVLTWEKNGLNPGTGYSEGMRLVWFADASTNPWGTHAFGNWDWHQAAESKYWYYYYEGSEKYPTTTGLSGFNISELIIYSNQSPQTPPGAPLDLRINGLSAGGIVINTLTPALSWSTAAGAAHYVVKISRFPYGQNNLIYSSPPLYGNTFAIPAGVLAAGERYNWQVQAFNSAGGSPDSNVLYFETTPPTPAVTISIPASPQNLRLAAAGPKQVSLAWNPPGADGGSPVSGYQVYRGTAPNAEIYYTSVTGTTFTDTGTTGGAVYYYKVAAVNAFGQSQLSNEVMAAVPAPSSAMTSSPPSTPLLTTTPVVTAASVTTATPVLTTAPVLTSTPGLITTAAATSTLTAASAPSVSSSTPPPDSSAPVRTLNTSPASTTANGIPFPGAAPDKDGARSNYTILIAAIAGLVIAALLIELILKYRKRRH